MHAGARRALTFEKTTVIGGVVFIAPLVLLVFLVVKATGLLQRLARPFEGILPIHSFAGLLRGRGARARRSPPCAPWAEASRTPWAPELDVARPALR